MNNQIANTSYYPAHPLIGRGAVLCGLWLRVAFIGASALAVGVMQMFDGEVKLLTALSLTVVGGLLTAFSARRARASLDAADHAPSAAVQSAGSPARSLAI